MEFHTGDGAVRVNVPDLAALERAVAERIDARAGFAVATLNLDHLVKLRSDQGFRAAYAAHDLVTADGNPIVWLSRMAGRRVSLVPGSDAILPLVHVAAAAGAPVGFVGTTAPALDSAADYLERRVPGLQVAARIAPAMGFDPEGDAADAVLDALEDAGVRLAFVALGAPKQERFAAHGRRRLPGMGFASIGAGLDFFAGTQVRAPVPVRAAAMEWAWRAAGDPRRLGPRYAACAAILPGLVTEAIEMRRRSEP
ncbi:WecB/TagA/CpsF family glycosyltransferase [Roseivivax marinus]|uniref:WecB/TagA/CpsF family glycosyltransferase n=1 Tax=Roseivivax marinus TaxID=1379903 RepID=UPI00273DA83F|nr:WecB/TagA/CpsF family glycosyltransferase [Roseivivax marinus]